MFKDLIVPCMYNAQLIYVDDQFRHSNYVNNMFGKCSDRMHFFIFFFFY